MKKNNKILIGILTVAIFLLMISCGVESPEEVPGYKEGNDFSDLDGYTMVISISTGHELNENVFGYIVNTSLADLALQRKSDVEEALNCKIKPIYSVYGDASANLSGSVVSGLFFCDVIQHESYDMLSYMRAGYFVGLSELLDVKNTYKWGTPNMLQSMCWLDNQYAVVPNAWPDLLFTSFGYPICINENLVASFGATDPREYVENYTWTWDQFEETLHALTQTTGDKTIYGMAVHSPYFGEMMVRSNGNSLVEYSNGTLVNGFYTPSARIAIERTQLIYTDTCKDCFHPDISTGGVVEAFVNGDAVMASPGTGSVLGTTNSIMYRSENVGIVPYPQGPDAIPGKYPSLHESLRFSTSIPITANDYEATAIILSAFYEPLPGYETIEDIVEYMMKQIFYDERDAYIYLEMLKNTEYSYFKEGSRAIQERITGYSGNTTSISQLLESLEGNYEYLFENYTSKHYQGILAVWGDELE